MCACIVRAAFFPCGAAARLCRGRLLRHWLLQGQPVYSGCLGTLCFPFSPVEYPHRWQCPVYRWLTADSELPACMRMRGAGCKHKMAALRDHKAMTDVLLRQYLACSVILTPPPCTHGP